MPSKKSPTTRNMRIIGGELKRRKLLEVTAHTTRSTKDKVKESLFNMLSASLPASRVLDAFAGSGALGIEALSRGANYVEFIDSSPQALRVLKANVSSLQVHERAGVHPGVAQRIMPTFETAFDIIFLDPPYKEGLIDEALKIITDHRLLSDTGIIAILSEKNASIKVPEALAVYKHKTQGITALRLLEWSCVQ